jgi:hypothetical protein
VFEEHLTVLDRQMPYELWLFKSVMSCDLEDRVVELGNDLLDTSAPPRSTEAKNI